MKLRVLLITLLLLAPLAPSISATPPKAGAICSKAGITKNYNGKKFTCIKSDKKLVWNKGVALKTPTPSPTPTPTPTPTTSVNSKPNTNPTSASINLCELRETSNARQITGLISGFPRKETYFPKKGNLKIAVIPIDWADLPGESDWESRIRNQIQLFDEYWKLMSGDNLKFSWVVQKTWIRLPGSSADYAVPYSEAMPDTVNFFSKVVPVVDKAFDFSNVDLVQFIAPKNQNIIPETTQSFPWGALNYPFKDGKVKAMTIVGKFFDLPGVFQQPRTYWSYWAHELAHVLEIAHLGSGRGDYPMGGYEMMGMQDGPSRSLSGWIRFLSGWLATDQVFCLPKESLGEVRLSLRPLDSDGSGIRLVIIPTSSSEGILIESRRETKFDVPVIEKPRNGILVYKYNGSLGHLQNYLTPLAPLSSSSDADAYTGIVRYIMKENDLVSDSGIEIEFNSKGTVDVITINKAGSVPRSGNSPKPQPSPSTTDFGVSPEISKGLIERLTETTGQAIFYGRYYNSYRLYVTSKNDPNSPPIFDTGFVNDYRFPISINITNLSCSRDLLAVIKIYSGRNGQGIVWSDPSQSEQLSRVELTKDGKCLGGFNNNGQGN